MRDCRTSDFNRKSKNGQYTDRPPDSIDENNPTNEFLTTESEAWQDGSNELISNQPRFISRTDGMSLKMAQFTSTGEFDDELSDPLPLGC